MLALWHEYNSIKHTAARTIEAGEQKGQNKARHWTTVFLTYGTPKQGLDFVSVLQPVPRAGKHFQSGFLSVTTCETSRRDRREGMYASRQ